MLFIIDIDIIGYYLYYKGFCKVWYVFEIEKFIINWFVYLVYIWVKCIKFKLSVFIYIIY